MTMKKLLEETNMSEDQLLKTIKLNQASFGFKNSFKIVMGYYLAQFVSTLIGLTILLSLIGGCYYLVK